MSAPAIPRRPVTTIRTPRTPRPRVPYSGLFQEASYEGGLTYGQLLERLDPGGEDDDDAEGSLPR